MATYKTPGVYVEEISVFPPSVAEVATAIPAFIGYTEKADTDEEMEPTPIGSLVEFKSIFGGGPPIEVGEVVVDGNNAFESAKLASTFYLYDSLRVFFDNGGGRCFIVSIGDYNSSPNKDKFQEGLAKLEKEDEPTMLVFPDAVLLEGDDDLYSLQKLALAQCGKLGDRFVVMDLKPVEPGQAGLPADTDEVKAFRQQIGIKDLKYGAAYMPHLKVSLSKTVRYRDISGKLKKYGKAVELGALNSPDEEAVEAQITNLKAVINDVKTVEDGIKVIRGGDETLLARYTGLLNTFRMADGDVARGSALAAMFKHCYEAANLVDNWSATLTHEDAVKSADSQISQYLKEIMTTVNVVLQPVILPPAPPPADPPADPPVDLSGFGTGGAKFVPQEWKSVHWDTLFDTIKATGEGDVGGTTDKLNDAEATLTSAVDRVNSIVTDTFETIKAAEVTIDNALAETFPVYKSIREGAARALTIIPPSGAVSGVYASVDRNRGVWKAPANVSLASVSGVNLRIDQEGQKSLNVDANSGKSINAIRPFTGKGTLVWGARTLAGNDNEWRYVPVRRFFNMIEESIKKSTSWAVFEPNDAKLWMKVKSMVENYLITKWREGALAGEKPEHAFFVNVGLGKTMTAQDILNGHLIVEIGVAVVRPAEFIILRFSHKLQES